MMSTMSLRWVIKLRAVSEGSDLHDAAVEGVDTEAGSSREGLAVSAIGASRTWSRAGKPGGVEGPRECASEESPNFPDAPLLPH